MRGANAAWYTVPVSWNAERKVSFARWAFHGAEDCGRDRANTAKRHEARTVFFGGEGRAASLSRIIQRMQGTA